MRRMPLALALVAALVLVVFGWGASRATTSSASTGQKDPVTISFWSPFTARELGELNKAFAGFHKQYPWITVKSTGNTNPTKLTAAIRGGNAPDAVALFETDTLGAFCASGAWIDLSSKIKSDKVNMNLFPKTIRDYTAYENKRCAMPLLADAYGFYYNKAMFAKAGIKAPPKTLSQLSAYAKRLTVKNSDGSIKVLGFNPLMNWYENSPVHFGPMTGATWMKDGKSNLANDPNWAVLLRWQRSLVDALGYDNLKKWEASAGDEWTASNAFLSGKLAMNFDGEYRTAFLTADAPTLKYGTAPHPVSTSSLYGSGFVIGTIMGIPKGSDHEDEAWLLIKYLATNSKALTQLSLGLRNVPSTLPTLKNPVLRKDKNFKVFLDIFGNPKSSTQPVLKIGAQNQTLFATFVEKWQAGRVKSQDLHAGLANVDKQIDAAIAQSGQVP
jgi:multiple sugar transport system substrate-binding protein